MVDLGLLKSGKVELRSTIDREKPEGISWDALQKSWPSSWGNLFTGRNVKCYLRIFDLFFDFLSYQAEQDRRILQEELFAGNNRIFVKFINKISQKMKELKKIPKFYLRWVHQPEVHRGSEDYYGIMWETTRIAKWSKLYEWFKGVSGCWVGAQWKFTRYQSTRSIP